MASTATQRAATPPRSTPLRGGWRQCACVGGPMAPGPLAIGFASPPCKHFAKARRLIGVGRIPVIAIVTQYSNSVENEIRMTRIGSSLETYRHRKGEPMRRLALAFALGIAVSIVMLTPAASAWTRGGHGHGFVVAGPGFVVAGPRVPVPFPVVGPFPHRVFVAPRGVFVAPRAVVVAPPVPFFAPAPWPGCAHWWWNGWRWVRGC